MAAAGETYWRLTRLPGVAAILIAAALSRLGQRMLGFAIVLYALTRFDSPVLAGWLSFTAIAPGLVISPLAGVLLDRAGTTRSIAIDLTARTGLVLALMLVDLLEWASPPVLLWLTFGFALTSPLSAAGVKVLLPRLVPAGVSDRAFAMDTAIYALVDVTALPLAGVLMGFGGSALTFGAIAAAYAGASVCMALVPRQTATARTGRVLTDAVEGLVYVWRQPSLRGLAIGYSLNMVTWGILTVTVPVALARLYGLGSFEGMAGLVWAGAGIGAGIGALADGKGRVFGREARTMVTFMLATAFVVWPVAASFGVVGLASGLAMCGLLAGPIDVCVLTLRQRRTDPARLGRVLAISMSLNMSGFPIGAALGGILASWSVPAAFMAGALASVFGAVAIRRLVPDAPEAAR